MLTRVRMMSTFCSSHFSLIASRLANLNPSIAAELSVPVMTWHSQSRAAGRLLLCPAPPCEV